MSRVIVVTGFKRCGTSLMMRILQEMGIPAHYDKEFEKEMLKSTTPNPYFFEDKDMMHKGFKQGQVPRGHCVKIFYNGITDIPSGCNVIEMIRDRKGIEESLSRYKTPEEVTINMKEYDTLNVPSRVCRESNIWFVCEFEKLISEPEVIIERLAKSLGKECDIKEVAKCVKRP